MLTQPVDKVGSIDTASGEIQDESFLIVDRGVDLRAVENEKCFHGSVPYSLVAIDKGVVLNQREAERCRLINQRGIQIGAAKGSLRLDDRRLKCAKITDAGCAAGGLEEASMQRPPPM